MKNLNIDITEDLWTYLSKTKKPIVMYGMGNGADKILAICEQRGIIISDFFASDGFVRGHSFHGKCVLSYSQITEKYGKGNFIVLLSFASSLQDVIQNIERIAEETELYAPDVPAFGNGLFDLDFFETHKQDMDFIAGILADEKSKEIYERVIKYKLSGNISHLRGTETNYSNIFGKILHPNNYRTALDAGAYTGDTIRELISYAPNIENIIALEPDSRNFKKLLNYSESEKSACITPLCVGAWSKDDNLFINKSGNRNSNISNKKKQGLSSVEVKTIDGILSGRSIDFIKYDVEGAEHEAILGSEKSIRRFAPELSVSLYHRVEDVFVIPKLIHSLMPEYRLYIRRFPYIPAWDMNLYATK